MTKPTILVDLKVAMNNGYCGIAKENRLVFKMLSDVSSPTGLLISQQPTNVFSGYRQCSSNEESIAQVNRFFHEALPAQFVKNKLIDKFKLKQFVAVTKNKFDVFNIHQMFNDVIWRNIFSQSLTVADKAKVLQNKFCFTNMSHLHLRVSSYFRRYSQLNTTGFNIALFLEPLPVQVSPGTIKLFRYHDAIPITDPDFSGSRYSYNTLNTLSMTQDAYFVCNSEPSRTALLTIKPELEKKTFMIPCGMTSSYQRVNDEEKCKQILLTRLSSEILAADKLPAIRAQLASTEKLNYVLSLAALDPKKNHTNLLKAWEQLNYQFKDKIKLVLVANRSGWSSLEVENKIRHHAELGNIIHLDNVADEEVSYLYSHAQAFIFPSFTEGFGLPPLEAMQCGCPVIASDIPAHKWVLGDAAVLCDPYDVTSLKNAMEKVLQSEEVSKELVSRGYERVKRYEEGVLQGEWQDLLGKLGETQSSLRGRFLAEAIQK